MEKIKYHTTLSNYFSAQPHFFDGDLQKKPHIRKCVEQPFQQTKAELWDEVTATLCNLDFIQAKAVAKMTYDLIKDFNDILDVIPDNADNIRKEKSRQARMDKYTRDLIACAKGEIGIDELEIPESITPWSKEKIDAEIERIKINPTRSDRLKDFRNFLGQETGNLQHFASEFPYFVVQQAWNYADNGPVGSAAEKGLSKVFFILLLKGRSFRPTWNPKPQILTVLKVLSGANTNIAITPDGKWAFLGSVSNYYFENTCILCDLLTGQVTKTLKGHIGQINSVDITPDGKKGISGSDDNYCIIWDLEAGQAINVLRYPVTIDNIHENNKSNIISVSLTPDGNKAVVLSSLGSYVVWDLNTGSVLNSIGLKNQYTFGSGLDHCLTTYIRITPNGKKAVAGSYNNICLITNMDTKQCRKILEGHKFVVSAIAITPDGKRAITGTIGDNFSWYEEGCICIVWDLISGKAIQTLMGHTDGITSVAITPDGRKAISGSLDCSCIIWDLDTGKVARILRKHTDRICSVAITADGTKAFSSSFDMTCILWDLNSNLDVDTPKYEMSSTAVTVTPNGERAISCHNDHNCIVWEICTGKMINTMKWHTDSVLAIAITPDGKRAITGSKDKSCVIWDLNSGKVLRILQGHSSAVNHIAIAPSGRNAVSTDSDGKCIIWDLLTYNPISVFKVHDSEVDKLAITSDGKRIITSSFGTCITWDLCTGKMVHSFNTLGLIYQEEKCIAFIQNGKKVITDSGHFIWDMYSDEPISFLEKHIEAGTSAIATTKDDNIAFIGYKDKTCVIWDLLKEQKLAIYFSDSTINAISYFPGIVFLGLASGNINILEVNTKLICTSGNNVLIRGIWDFEFQNYFPISADCPLCGHRFVPPTSVLAVIEGITKNAGLKPEQSPCLELPDETWEDPGLLSNCPKCEGELKFNPFITGGEN